MILNNYKCNNLLILGLITVVFATLLLISCDKSEDLPVIPLPPGCIITNVTFATIGPLIQGDCSGCHNNSTKHGGINLEGYDNIKSVALSGKLLSSIKGTMSGYFSGTDCDYLKIDAWIKNSAPQ
jgi:hypothetical protein